MKTGILSSLRLKNFKAVRDSGLIEFTPLTVFIGNNGSGKSSIVEGLETLQQITQDDLDVAMEQWRGFEHVWNQGVEHTLGELGKQKRKGRRKGVVERPALTGQMSFSFSGKYRFGEYSASLDVASGPGGNELFIASERVNVGRGLEISRDSQGKVKFKGRVPIEFGHIRVESDFSESIKIDDGRSIIGEAPYLEPVTGDWQFVSLIPQQMGWPTLQRRAGGTTQLEKDGSNIAEYLHGIRKTSQEAFDGIVDTVRYVLGYARDIQPALSSELERNVYLLMSEDSFKVPGWMLSTGTIRILALLALLRHPDPSPLIVIEEIENGLDPRAIHLIVDEIRNAVESGKTQVILTTHSPYLLDLLTLSQIVVVERVENQPVFSRPNQKELKEWTRKFTPGRLYTMGKISGKGR